VISTVAVGTDGSPTAAEAVRVATELAQRFEAELVLLSASRESKEPAPRRGQLDEEMQWAHSASARAREILARAQEEAQRQGISCRTLIDEGDPAEVLVRLASECDADLLVIGNKGIKRRVLGSVPNTVTHKAPCSVVVVKTT
jgi:nucleotide-binding universal stress UspA family protein